MNIERWRNDRDELARKLLRNNEESNVVSIGILQARKKALIIMTEETLAYWYCRMINESNNS